jgi:hypothetical protein
MRLRDEYFGLAASLPSETGGALAGMGAGEDVVVAVAHAGSETALGSVARGGGSFAQPTEITIANATRIALDRSSYLWARFLSTIA